MTKKILLLIMLSVRLCADGDAPKLIDLTKGDLKTRARGNGAVTYSLKNTNLCSTFLMIHWIRSQMESRDQVVIREGDTIRYSGRTEDIEFDARIHTKKNSWEAQYSIQLLKDLPMGPNRPWELSPSFDNNTLEKFRDCSYEFRTSDGRSVKGNIREMLQNLSNVTSWTIYGYKGYNFTLHFPSGATVIERRGEKKPQGIAIFYHLKTEKGIAPQKKGESGTLQFRITCEKIGESLLPNAGKDKPIEGSQNVLYNPSFEQETNPGYADGWGPRHNFFRVHRAGILNHIPSYYAIDRKIFFDGKQSLRLMLPDGYKELELLTPYVRTLPGGTDAVFSAYMRGANDKQSVVSLMIRSLDGSKVQEKRFILSDKWERYEFSFKVPLKHYRFQPWILLEKGIAWIDAVQIENGKKASRFSATWKNRSMNKSQFSSTKKYSIPVLPQKPSMSGDLSDSVWKKALKFDKFHIVGTGKECSENQTTAYLATHGNHLYAAFECQGKSGTPLVKLRDGQVWRDDSVELFLDPGIPVVADADKSIGSYYHIAVNSLGTVFDIFCGGNSGIFNGKIQTACKRYPDKWICEISMDLASLNQFPVKENWRFNLGREDHLISQYSSVFPISKTTFHSYDEFGYASINSQITQNLNRVSVRKVELLEGNVSILLNAEEKIRDLSLSVDILENEKNLFSKTIEKNLPKGDSSIFVPFQKTNTSFLTVNVSGKSPDGASFQKQFQLKKNGECFFRRNYYTDEKEAELIYGNTLPKISGNTVSFGTKKCPFQRGKNSILIDIAALAPGEYMARIGTMSIPFKKLPRKKNEVKIDRLQNMLIVDDKPFIIQASYLTLGNQEFFLHETYTLPLLKKMGFNTVKIILNEGYSASDQWSGKNGFWSLARCKEFLDICSDNELKVMIFAPLSHSRSSDWKRIFVPETLIPLLKDHPALLSWEFCDEPIPEMRKEIWDRYNYAVSHDPYHPVTVNVTTSGLAQKVVLDPLTGKNPFEIYSLTYYPVACAMFDTPEAPIGNTWVSFEQMFQEVRKEQGVLCHAAQAWGYGTDHWYREPTPDEIQFLYYMPLIMGNRGWVWFGGRPLCEETFQAIGVIGKEILSLTPILANSQKKEDDIPLWSICGNVMALYRRQGDTFYLITVNKSNTPVTTRFKDLAGNVEVLFENRKHNLNENDVYKPYQRHVYKGKIKERR